MTNLCTVVMGFYPHFILDVNYTITVDRSAGKTFQTQTVKLDY